MKTFLLTSLAAIGVIISAPTVQARDHGHRHHYRTYDRHYSSYGYRSDCQPRSHYGRSYSYPTHRYYRVDRCYPERRHSYRPPLISLLFVF